MAMTVSSVKNWKKHVKATKSCMLLKDIDDLCVLEQHLTALSDGCTSLEVGRSLPDHISKVISQGMFCTMVGQLKDGVVIVRDNSMDISFMVVQTSGDVVSVLRTIYWPLDNFRSNVGCIIPHPQEMDFLVRVSCTGSYGMIVGPATEAGNRAVYPKVVLVTPTKNKVLQIRHEARDGWPANLEFHPHIDRILAVLHCNQPTWDCPYPRFSYTPVILMLYDVLTETVISVLSQTPLSPQLLSFTSDGKEIVVTSAMQIKNYAVKSVSKGNSCNILMVSSECEEISSDESPVISDKAQKIICDASQVISDRSQVISERSQVISDRSQVISDRSQVISDRSQVISDATQVNSVSSEGAKMNMNQSETESSIQCSGIKVTGSIPAPRLCDWHFRETDDHVHKSLYTTAVTSLNRRTIHVLAVSTLSTSENTVFTLTRADAMCYVDRLMNLCRVALLRRVCSDDVHKLPIPTAMKQFVKGL